MTLITSHWDSCFDPVVFVFPPVVVDVGILKMDFHLARKAINRYEKESLAWPSVH